MNKVVSNRRHQVLTSDLDTCTLERVHSHTHHPRGVYFFSVDMMQPLTYSQGHVLATVWQPSSWGLETGTIATSW